MVKFFGIVVGLGFAGNLLICAGMSLLEIIGK
jgi:hypothetical protein